MVMRFLFGLTGSLLSGSVVAVLFTALMQYVFPDTAEYQKPASLHVVAPRDGLTARMIGMPEQPASPRASAALTAGIREPARSSEVNPPAREDPVAPGHGSNTGAAGLPPHPEPAALAQAGAQSKEQLLSASAPADLLTQSERDAEAPTTSPDRPPQQDETAHGMQPIAEASAPGQNPEPSSLGHQEASGNKPTKAGDVPGRSAAGSRSTRGRSVNHTAWAEHAHRRQSHHQVDHRLLIRQAERHAQE
jgi:hypothetical protein